MKQKLSRRNFLGNSAGFAAAGLAAAAANPDRRRRAVGGSEARQTCPT